MKPDQQLRYFERIVLEKIEFERLLSEATEIDYRISLNVVNPLIEPLVEAKMIERLCSRGIITQVGATEKIKAKVSEHELRPIFYYRLAINAAAYSAACRKLELVAEKQTKPISLTSEEVSFDRDSSRITVGVGVCEIPPAGLEDELCRIIFHYPKLTSLEWDEIAEEIAGREVETEGKEGEVGRARIYNAVRLLNKRVRLSLPTNEDLLQWARGRVRRRF